MVGSCSSVAVRCSAPGQLVEPEPAVVGRALDERIAERADVPRRHPDLRVHQDPGVEADDVVALLDHRPPPRPLDVVLELDAEGAVVPHGVDAAVDLARGEDEAAPLASETIVSRSATAGATSAGSTEGVVTGGLRWYATLAGPRGNADDPMLAEVAGATIEAPEGRGLTSVLAVVDSADRPTSVTRPTEPTMEGRIHRWRTTSRASCSRFAPATSCARAGSARTPTAGPATRRSPGTSTAAPIEGVDVSGRTVALSVHIPGQRPRPEVLEGGRLRRRRCDRRAAGASSSRSSPGQLGGAIADLAGLIGEVVSVERVPITFTVDGGKGRLTIGHGRRRRADPVHGCDRQADDPRRRPSSRRSRARPSTPPRPTTSRATASPHGLPNVNVTGHNALQGHFHFAA